MHLATETALNLLSGHLDSEEQSFWKAHMQSCDACAAQLQGWLQLEADLRQPHLKSATAEDLARAYSVFPEKAERAGTPLRQIIAAVVFDNFLQPAFAGTRGSAGLARQMVLRAEEFDIHIKIRSDGERTQLMGQLLPRATSAFVASARFHLLRNGERVESTNMNELGEFHFTDVPEGHLLSLQIDLPNATVVGALHAVNTDDSGQQGEQS